MKNPSKYLGNELKYIKKVLNSESWSSTSGSWTTKLEHEFAKKFQTKYAVAFNSGTSTMHAGLLALGVKPRDEVISPAFTVFMNTSTTIHANAIPKYVDIDPETFNIDANDLERKITKNTKAIMITSVYGLSPDMHAIKKIANKHKIPILEDNAECFLGYYNDQLVGTFGDISSFSFENSKHISCGEGGMITTNNSDYAEACRKIGCHGFKDLQAGDGRIKLEPDKWQNPNFERHGKIGWNYRLPEFNSAIALAQLERLESLVEMRIKSANCFLEVMSDCNYLIPQKTPKNYINSFWALGARFTNKDVSWYDFRKKYMSLGGDGIYGAWKVPYLEPAILNKDYVNLNPLVYENIEISGSCPNAELIQKEMMVFKTNYRDIALAEKKAEVLQKTIRYFS